jgi:putative DNA primase/helicase
MTTAPDPCQHLSPFFAGPKWYSATAGTDASRAANAVFAMGTDEWDRDPWLLNTPDGTVDLRTGWTRPHRREDHLTKVTTISPADIGCPLFMEFMKKITNSDAELIAFLQRSLGYAMTGITREHALFFWYGRGGNGKSVLLNTIAGILGEYHTNAAMETFVDTHGDCHPTELAALRGAHL